MSDIEKKPRVGVALLNMVATLADRRLDEAQPKEIEAIEKLEEVAQKLNLDKMFIVGVSPEVFEVRNGYINSDKSTTFDDLWHLSSCLAYNAHLWHHSIRCKEDDESKPKTPHLEYLGVVCRNGFMTPNPTYFVKKDGVPVTYSYDTVWEIIEHPEQFEIAPEDERKTFNIDTKSYMTRITIDSEVPHESSYGEPCFKATAEKMLDFLKDLAKKYDIRQIITCTDNSVCQERIGSYYVNILDSEQITNASGAPVITILNDIYPGGSGYSSRTIEPKNDGFSGICNSNERFAFGFANGMKCISGFINETKSVTPQRKNLQHGVNPQNHQGDQ